MNKIDEQIFESAFSVIEKIFPLHRSISGSGINEAFEYLNTAAEGRMLTYPTGELVFDWMIPQDWVCNDVAIFALNDLGEPCEKIISFDHPLRVASHSCRVNEIITGRELREKLVYSKKYPNSLSHRYIYYREDWSISVTKAEFDNISIENSYLVKIDANKQNGELKVHEVTIKGIAESTIFLLSHLCHPCQFNDGLVGVLLNLYLYKYIQQNYKNTKYTYKFLTFPETIGSHAYCSDARNLENGIFAIFSEMTALDQPIHVQKSRGDDDYVNKVIDLAAKECNLDVKFSPFLKVIRNDEKVFNAPGIDIPAASITRAWGPGHENHPFFGYHTSLDDMGTADMGKLKEVISLYQVILHIIENDYIVERRFHGIPMLSRHNLFVDPLYDRQGYNLREALVWELSNTTQVSAIAINLGVSFSNILNILKEWASKDLILLKSI